MAESSTAGSAPFYSREAFGERLGGFIYGTIVAISVVIAGAKIYPDRPGHVAAFVAVATFVLWLAHVYAHGLAQSVTHDQHVSLVEPGHVVRQEASILEAGFRRSSPSFSARPGSSPRMPPCGSRSDSG